MLALDELLAELKYDQSPHYRDSKSKLEPETAHLFRAAFDKDVGVSGIYVFETSQGSQDKVLPAQPAVYIADVQIEDEAKAKAKAKSIHRSLWNLCYAPYIIVRLPHQIRIYTGFNYDEESNTVGLLDTGTTDTPQHLEKLREILANFNAEAIDTGRIWQSKYAEELNPNQRVDEHLLENLRKLGNALKEDGLRDEVAHALIGKYVFLSYLRERDILSKWLAEQGIDPESVFSFRATKSSLLNLIEALKDFNGKIFPIKFDEPTLDDKHVSWVASVISKGDKLFIANTPDKIIQLHLPFQAYDFRYIPVETLSAIYEQFIADEDKKTRKEKGAVYTPEFLADYLLSEVNSAKPLKKGMKILDPACGAPRGAV